MASDLSLCEPEFTTESLPKSGSQSSGQSLTDAMVDPTLEDLNASVDDNQSVKTTATESDKNFESIWETFNDFKQRMNTSIAMEIDVCDENDLNYESNKTEEEDSENVKPMNTSIAVNPISNDFNGLDCGSNDGNIAEEDDLDMHFLDRESNETNTPLNTKPLMAWDLCLFDPLTNKEWPQTSDSVVSGLPLDNVMTDPTLKDSNASILNNQCLGTSANVDYTTFIETPISGSNNF
ncbi:unnamed protein product [Oppiella nova]|uniref:Uncharacterized protein n=1 Tax=Oppiella nova TaxID=334625 RepID=A0A7R9M404_9ACAR|nr:unnamed protein product [Oppiella nova]CAG2170357.1 unnamed protein product [Oppiella nova]